MKSTSRSQPSCMDCRWLDIQVDAGRESFWCFKKLEEITGAGPRREACELFEWARPYP